MSKLNLIKAKGKDIYETHVRDGVPRKEVAERFGISLSCVDYWVKKLTNCEVPRRKPISESTKAKILKLHLRGVSQRGIAAQVSLSIGAVNYWINWTPEGKKKNGRKRATDEETDKLLVKMSEESPFMSAVDIRNVADLLQVSHQTIRNRLKERGLRNYTIAIKGQLTEEEKKDRLEFARNYESWTVDDWKKVWFSGEKIFANSHRECPKMCSKEKKKNFESKETKLVLGQTTKNLAVWGYIAVNERNLHHISQSPLDAEYYVENILKEFLPLGRKKDVVFGQDRSNVHAAYSVQTYLESNGFCCISFPSKAPDLNLVENVWAELEHQIKKKMKDTMNAHDTYQMVHEAFECISSEFIEELYCSMPKRIKEVILAQGN